MKARFGVIRLEDLFSFGAEDDNKPKPKPGPAKKTAAVDHSKKGEDEEDEDDEDDDDLDEKDIKIRHLLDENYKKRQLIKKLKTDQEELASRVEELEAGAEEKDSKDSGIQRKYDSLAKKYNALEEDHTKLLEHTATSTIRSAILNTKKYEWHDVNMALDLLDREQLAVDTSDGSVGGLEAQLKAIAKQKPFLLKNAGGGQQEGSGKPTGSAPQSHATGTRGQEATSDQDKMLSDFPALRMVSQ